jgi:hypothetical protein
MSNELTLGPVSFNWKAMTGCTSPGPALHIPFTDGAHAGLESVACGFIDRLGNLNRVFTRLNAKSGLSGTQINALVSYGIATDSYC